MLILVLLLSVSVSSVSLSPTNDYDDDGLCVWACSGHGDCYIDDGEKLPSCHCEVRIFCFRSSFSSLDEKTTHEIQDGWSGVGCQTTSISIYPESEVANDKDRNVTEEPQIEVSVLPSDAGLPPLGHQVKTVKLIRAIRGRIRHLQSLPDQASHLGELEELQLALDTVGGTKGIWDQDVIDHVVAQNVKSALDHATPAVETDPDSFHLLKPSS